MKVCEFAVNKSYRLLSEPNQVKPPPQFEDFVGFYVYAGWVDGFNIFTGIHYLRGKETLKFTDSQLLEVNFEPMFNLRDVLYS